MNFQFSRNKRLLHNPKNTNKHIMSNAPSNTLDFSLPLIKKLISEQFPHWAHLHITSIPLSGIDNRTFRLGESMSIRLPSAGEYTLQVEKEQKFLPFLAPHLSFPIPEPLAIGQPSKLYPYHWSINRWLPGESAESLLLKNENSPNLNLHLIASQLAQFLNELHKINPITGPRPGPHNYYRGASPEVYDTETRAALFQLSNLIDVRRATALWEKALSSKWTQNPVWIHGDFSAGNILIQNNRLSAIIDFGCMGIGDPACDLVITWTLLTKETREIFASNLSLDFDTWARARGWALWKSLITIAALKDKTSSEARKNLQIIAELINEHIQS